MSKFIQLHLLTSYPPANLNRDDLGRPKTAMMGGANRLRISSQSLKRAWRSSNIFKTIFEDTGQLGKRTKRIGLEWIYPQLIDNGIADELAQQWSRDIQLVFGEPEDIDEDNPISALSNKQLAFIAPDEKAALEVFCKETIVYLTEGKDPQDNFKKIEKARKQKDKKKRHATIRKIIENHVLNLKHTAADIALFGRMLASSPAYNTEAAAQVAHAISVHKVTVEDDFFTAVDDLNKGEEDMGAGHMGETEFAAALFYLYLCIDRELLTENLSGDAELADKTINALIQSAATIAPSGKQNSFASRARASYILCESGDQQPRSLSVAFLKPVGGTDLLRSSIEALEQTRQKMDQVYGDGPERIATLNALTGEGSLQGIIDCTTGA